MGIIQDNLTEQHKHLDDVITNENWWYCNKFRVMNNEAGSGKSYQTYKSVAKLATTTDKSIIYVQMFANKDSEKQDGELLKATVDEINEHAEENIAGYLCAENRRYHKKILSEKQIICITHKKYLELCKEGKKSNFISNADVLIIDEFPNLFESFYVSALELTKLQGFTLLSEKDKENIEEMNKFLMKKLNELQNKYGKSEMRIINLQKLDIKKYIEVLKTIIKNAKKDNEIAHKNTIMTANKVLELLKHSSVYTLKKIGNKNYPVLYSYYKDTNYILAKENNIILDANGNFDIRYKLRPNSFKVDNQSKVYDYSDSKINMYPINTTKTALRGYKNILLDVCLHIEQNFELSVGFGSKGKYLIVTDINTEGILTDFQKEHFKIMNNIDIAHFGALIGKNDWREYDNAWIIKTPFYSWIEYILQYLFYSQEDLNGNTNCQFKQVKCEYGNYSIFRNKEFNEFKNSIVLGEYYQALKRIARDGRKCTFNILMLDEAIFNMLKKQFINIKSQIKNDLTINVKEKKENKKTGKEPVKTNERLNMIKDCIINAKKEGKNKIAKQELVKLLGIKKTKLSPLLKKVNDVNFEIGKGKEQAYILL